MSSTINRTMPLTDPQSLENPEHKQMIEQANQLIAQGKTKSAVDGELEPCCSMMAEACELYTKVFGDFAVECIRPYIYYGCALLELGRHEHGVVSSDKTQEIEDEGAMEEEENEEEVQEEINDDDMETEEPLKVHEESTADKESDNESEKAEGHEDESNLRHALTILDIAIVVCDKHIELDNIIKIEKAECLLRKSEILQEFDDFQQAILTVQESLFLQNSANPIFLRMRAESFYYLGIIFQNMECYDKASEAYNHCGISLKERIAELTTPGYQGTAESIQSEVTEINEIMAELEIKIIDVKMSSDERLKKHVKAAMTDNNDALRNKTKPEQTHVDMTSRLVRKPTMDVNPQSDAME